MTSFVSGDSVFSDGTPVYLSPNMVENPEGGRDIDLRNPMYLNYLGGVTLELFDGEDGPGDNVVYTSDASDRIRSGGGNDIINAGGGDDFVLGGDGKDILRGGSGDDEIFGGDGDDQLIGGDGFDIIEGGDGDDIIWGAAGDDIIRGGKGADVLSGGLGSDTFILKGDDLTFDDQDNVNAVDAIVDFNDNEDVFVLQDMQVNGVVSYDSGTGDVTLTDSADPDVSRVIAKLQPGLDITVIDQGEGDWTLL